MGDLVNVRIICHLHSHLQEEAYLDLEVEDHIYRDALVEARDKLCSQSLFVNIVGGNIWENAECLLEVAIFVVSRDISLEIALTEVRLGKLYQSVQFKIQELVELEHHLAEVEVEGNQLVLLEV